MTYYNLEVAYSKRENYKMFIEFIHIGKCGGGTVKESLTNSDNFKFNDIHTRKSHYNKYKKYLIVIRNPLQRFISAFYWKYDKTINNVDTTTEEEIFYNKYNNIDEFCNDLKKNSNILQDYNITNHMYKGIEYYLENLIDNCRKDQIIGVICQETLKDDVKNILDITVENRVHDNSSYSKNITDENYKVLKDYLKNEYLIIDKMYKYGWITNKQYKILSK